jgi:hypothetical protein
MSELRTFRCSTAARWLPRVLAAAVLVGAFFAAYRFDPGSVLSASRYLKAAVVVLGGMLGLWIMRKGGEVRTELRLSAEELTFVQGAREFSLRVEDVDRFEYETPFAQSRTWLSALVLRDRFGQQWRISALLAEGDSFVAELLERSGRSDLQAWSETLGLQRRMGRAGARVALGYAVAAAILLAGVGYYLH